MAVTLSDINATLEGMREEQERTTEVTRSLVDKISAQMEVTEKTNLRSLNQKKPSSGGILGATVEGLGKASSGLSGLMDFLLGSFGKLIKWGAIAAVAAFFFGEQIMDLFKNFESLTGINLASLIAENPLISAAIGYGLYQLVKMLLRWSLKAIGGALAGLGAAALSGILGSGADAVDVDERDKKKDGKDGKGGKGKGGKIPSLEPPKSEQRPKATPETKPPATPETKPPATPETKPKAVPETKPKATKSAPVPKPNPGSAAAKGVAKILGKTALRLVPGLGWAMLAVDAYLLYDWLSEPANLTPEEVEQRRIESGRAPGEIPTNENSSAAPNRRKAFEKEKEIQKTAAKLAAVIDVSQGDNPYANMAAGIIDPIVLQGKINAFNEYGVDRDKQRISLQERGIVSSVTTDLMQRDYKERTASSTPSGGVYTDARQTNYSSVSAPSYVLPMGPAVDPLDPGYATRRR
jgi:hypothetical protein